MTGREINGFEFDWKSLLLPVVLMLTGIAVLVIAADGLVSLDRVQNLWPAAIILVALADLFTEGPAADRDEHE
jgi:prepilin signal peptidase PulO-like enzyme (type II secretory pathway)